jgi:uncharacterized protein YjbI with pentapeptide repeats
MGNPEHLAKLEELSFNDWNEWRSSQSVALDFSGANLHGKNLVARNLRDADLRHADLSSATLGNADMKHADLCGADLRGATFDGTNLSGASLREADLQGVDLSTNRGLQTEQLAGADLTGTKLPDELTRLYEKLENVNNISESARKLFLAVLAACLYSWLTIATTTDVNLITNRASSPLPIIQTSIPVVGFYWVAPLLLLCVYFYFHFYLQKLWEELGSLPAIFPDGRPLHAKIDPWLLNDLVRAHLPKLNIDRPFLSYLQQFISVLLAWWVVPITMFLFWGRYLTCHEQTGTKLHIALLAISATAALVLYRLAVVTVRGTKRKPLGRRGMLRSQEGYQAAAFAVAVWLLSGVVSSGAQWGVPSNAPILGIASRVQGTNYGRRTDAATWIPRLMATVGYSPFADLVGAEVSQKKPTWSKSDSSLDFVVGARLKGVNLRHASANEAFLAGALLPHADMFGAVLVGADLRGADLSDAILHGAILLKADLRGAHLERADLGGAVLRGADLSNAHLSMADLNDADLTDATLRDAELDGVDLNHSDLRMANLSGADLHFADLGSADLDGAELTYSTLESAKNLDLKSVKSAIHWEKAFYSGEVLRELGLPANHGYMLGDEREEQFRQR